MYYIFIFRPTVPQNDTDSDNSLPSNPSTPASSIGPAKQTNISSEFSANYTDSASMDRHDDVCPVVPSKRKPDESKITKLDLSYSKDETTIHEEPIDVNNVQTDHSKLNCS